MLARDAVPGTKLCPNCGNILRAEDVLDPIAGGRHLRRELLFWVALAAILGFLWTANTTGERVGGLGAIILLGWLLRRSRQHASGMAVMKAGRYYCDYCHRRFEGEGLRELPPRRGAP